VRALKLLQEEEAAAAARGSVAALAEAAALRRAAAADAARAAAAEARGAELLGALRERDDRLAAAAAESDALRGRLTSAKRRGEALEARLRAQEARAAAAEARLRAAALRAQQQARARPPGSGGSPGASCVRLPAWAEEVWSLRPGFLYLSGARLDTVDMCTPCLPAWSRPLLAATRARSRA